MCKPYGTSIVTLSFGLIMLACHSSKAAKFVYQPEDYSAVEGKPAHFACIFKDITDDMEGKYEVIWTKDSYIISEPNNRFDLKRFSFKNQYAIRQHKLKIDPVTREDEGGYQCHLYFNDDIVLTSNTGELTVREIPLADYPSVKTEKLTYMIGEEVVVRCLCEKTNPEPRLEWPTPGVKLLSPRPSTSNLTHMWIEATMSATVNVNGTCCLECKLIVEDEVAPRYKCTELHIDIHKYHELKTEPAIPNTDDQPVTLPYIRTSRMPRMTKEVEISLAVEIPNEKKSLSWVYPTSGIIVGLVLSVTAIAFIIKIYCTAKKQRYRVVTLN